MISSTLLANGATVCIIGPNQEDLDRRVLAAVIALGPADVIGDLRRISKVYSDAAAAAGKPGKMYGIAGDIRLKVSFGGLPSLQSRLMARHAV